MEISVRMVVVAGLLTLALLIAVVSSVSADSPFRAPQSADVQRDIQVG